jgi:hypothetical protein
MEGKFFSLTGCLVQLLPKVMFHEILLTYFSYMHTMYASLLTVKLGPEKHIPW